jgi:hypothetical protein
MYCLICGAGIIAFVFLIIIPNRKASVELEREIKKADQKIEEQRILRPVFENLLNRAKQTAGTDLPVAPGFEMAGDGINAVTDLLQEIARHHNLEMKDISTDVTELMKNKKKMMMQLSLAGNFLKFREFLLDLSALPQLKQIEEIKIRAVEGTREYNLRIQMAQE